MALAFSFLLTQQRERQASSSRSSKRTSQPVENCRWYQLKFRNVLYGVFFTLCLSSILCENYALCFLKCRGEGTMCNGNLILGLFISDLYFSRCFLATPSESGREHVGCVCV